MDRGADSIKRILKTSIKRCRILVIICSGERAVRREDRRGLLARVWHELEHSVAVSLIATSPVGQRNKFHPGVGRGSRGVSLTLSLGFFHLDGVIFAQDGVNFTRHEGPWGVGVGQGTLVATRTIYLLAGALPLDALP